MVQVFDPTPRPSSASNLGQALGLGLRGFLEGREQQQQQSSLAQSLFGDQAQQFANLPYEQQIAIAKLQQEQQKALQKQQSSQSLLKSIYGSQQPAEGQGVEQALPQDGLQQEGLQTQTQFDASKIPDALIAQVELENPPLAKILQQQKDTALKEKRFQKEFEEKQRLTSPDFRREQELTREQAKNDAAYNKELQSAHKQHELKTQTLNRLEQLNKKGVTGKPYEKLLEKFGLISLTADGRREFAADVKNLITDIRSILGGQFSQFEFQTILNAYPSADFSPSANSAIIKNLQEFQNIRKKEFEIANELKKDNKGKLPQDFQSQVNERLQEYAQSRIPEIKKNTQQILADEYGIKKGNVLLLDPSGEPLDVSPEEVEKYISRGATYP